MDNQTINLPADFKSWTTEMKMSFIKTLPEEQQKLFWDKAMSKIFTPVPVEWKLSAKLDQLDIRGWLLDSDVKEWMEEYLVDHPEAEYQEIEDYVVQRAKDGHYQEDFERSIGARKDDDDLDK